MPNLTIDQPQLTHKNTHHRTNDGRIIGRVLSLRKNTPQVIEVLTDPASAGEGGDADEPLLLVQKLALDETDVIFGAFETRFLKHVPDAAAWSPLPGGFNRWLNKYYRTVLRGTRPVLVTVHVRESLP